jgi:hypothetical protein
MNSLDLRSSQNSLDELGMPESYEQPEDIFSMNKFIKTKNLEKILVNINMTTCNRYV